MNVNTLIAAAAVALMAASPALAVDLVNEDQISYEVQLDDGKEVRTITIGAGATIPNVCEDCVVSVGSSSADTEEAKVVTIQNGALDSK